MRSAYGFFNPDQFDDKRCHPSYTMYHFAMKENIDYIFYSPETMRVTKLLDLPKKEDLENEWFLPSKNFTIG